MAVAVGVRVRVAVGVKVGVRLDVAVGGTGVTGTVVGVPVGSGGLVAVGLGVGVGVAVPGTVGVEVGNLVAVGEKVGVGGKSSLRIGVGVCSSFRIGVGVNRNLVGVGVGVFDERKAELSTLTEAVCVAGPTAMEEFKSGRTGPFICVTPAATANPSARRKLSNPAIALRRIFDPCLSCRLANGAATCAAGGN